MYLNTTTDEPLKRKRADSVQSDTSGAAVIPASGRPKPKRLRKIGEIENDIIQWNSPPPTRMPVDPFENSSPIPGPSRLGGRRSAAKTVKFPSTSPVRQPRQPHHPIILESPSPVLRPLDPVHVESPSRHLLGVPATSNNQGRRRGMVDSPKSVHARRFANRTCFDSRSDYF